MRRFLCLFWGLCSFSFQLWAESEPVWLFTPLTPTTLTVPSNGFVSVQYRVQNQSSKAKQLYLSHIEGVSAYVAPGQPPNQPLCTLAPQGQDGDSCILTLNVSGESLATGVTAGGPKLCQGAQSTLECYQPQSAQQLKLTRGEATLYSVGGKITGLSQSGLRLQNNGAPPGGENLAVQSGARFFEFPTALAMGSNYRVTVATQPTGEICTASLASGVDLVRNVNTVNIVCNATTYPVSVNVSGLLGSGLILQNNSADNLTVSSSGTASFTTGVASGGGYNVTVLSQPSGQVCTVNNATGSNLSAPVTVNVVCSSTTYTHGGTLSGLSGVGLVLRSNGGDDLSITSGATQFQFPTPLAARSSYNVTVAQHPQGQVCSVKQGSGTDVTADVDNISVNCLDTINDAFIVNNGGSNVLRFTVNTSSGLFSNPIEVLTQDSILQPYNIAINRAETIARITTVQGVSQCHVSNRQLNDCSEPVRSGSNGNMQGIALSPLDEANYFVTINGGNEAIKYCQPEQGSEFDTCSNAGGSLLSYDPSYILLRIVGSTIKAYIVNNSDNPVVYCDVNGGLLSNCNVAVGRSSLFYIPYGMTINKDNTFALVTNYESSGRGGLSKGSVVRCDVEADGTFSACNATAGGASSGIFVFDGPINIILNDAETLAFVVNKNTNTLTRCDVGASGTLSNCNNNTGVTNLNGPWGIVLL